MSDWKWNEKGVAKKKGGGEERGRGMIDFRQRNNRFDNLSMDDFLRLLERSSSCFYLFEVGQYNKFFWKQFQKIKYNDYVALSRAYKIFIFVDTDEIAESSLMGFLAKLESITCKRTASLFAIIDSPNVSYKRVQGRGGGRIF